MKKKIIIYTVAGIVVILAVFLLAKLFKSKNGRINPAFSEYISAFTSGRISANSTIRIEFSRDVAKGELNTAVRKL